MVLGTIRLTWLKDIDFIAHDVYEFGRLATILGIDEIGLRKSVARLDRVAVSLEKRRSRLFVDLWNKGVELLHENSTLCIVGAASAESKELNRIWRKLGFNAYHTAESNGLNATVYYLDLRHVEGLTD